MQLNQFNQLDQEHIKELLLTCCGSQKWVSAMCSNAPFASIEMLANVATDIWYNQCNQQDWLEAFTHHPKIGDVKSLEEKFASTKHFAGNEQAGVQTANKQVIQALAQANEDYELKFGFIFIVCATGKSANEMLRLLQERQHNSYNDELAVAMGEQQKITLIRLQKLLIEEDWTTIKQSQLTTHVLDTSIGKPGSNISITLQREQDNAWRLISQGITNADGRIADLLPPGRILPAGNYKMVFHTGNYFNNQNIKTFYPLVEIRFSMLDDQHYHVPLLVNPFGYTTYRGS